jgi:hypothetical protein
MTKKKVKSFIIAVSFVIFFICFGFSLMPGGQFLSLSPRAVNFIMALAGADTTPPFISNLAVTPDKLGATLLWNTNEPSSTIYSWGTTDLYADGTKTDDLYSTAHRVVLGPIARGVTYYYKIESKDESGNTSLFMGTFAIDTKNDTTAPANPSNFKIISNDDSLILTWVNPRDSDFASVKIVRSSKAYSLNPSTGNVIYEGKALKTIDSTPAIGVKYYYSIFAKDTWENYSSGVFANAKIPLPPVPSVVVPIPPVITATTTPVIVKPPIISPTTTVQIVVPTKVTTHSTSSGQVTTATSTIKKPEITASTTKPIATTTPEKEKSTSSPVVLAPSLLSSEPVQQKPLFDMPFLPSSDVKYVNTVVRKVTPTALPVGVAVGVSQSISLMSSVGSLYDVYLVFLKFIGVVLGFFGRKKPKSWGVVYDSVTKRPIDPAYVVMEDVKGENKKTAITDLDGRYGFLAEPGTYSITVNKTHYKFPSQILEKRTRDEMYDDLYFGEIFENNEQKVIQYNIPLDPVEFDWNEFIKNKEHIFNSYSRKEKIRSFFSSVLFLVGFFLSFVAIIFSPTMFNFVFFTLYIAIVVFQKLWKRKHKIMLLLGKDRKPIPFALVSTELSGLSIPIVKKVTTDILGRFYLLTQPGVYDIKVEEKQSDGTYKEIYKVPSVELKNGVLTHDIIVE